MLYQHQFLLYKIISKLRMSSFVSWCPDAKSAFQSFQLFDEKPLLMPLLSNFLALAINNPISNKSSLFSKKLVLRFKKNKIKLILLCVLTVARLVNQWQNVWRIACWSQNWEGKRTDMSSNCMLSGSNWHKPPLSMTDGYFDTDKIQEETKIAEVKIFFGRCQFWGWTENLCADSSWRGRDE